MASTAVEPLREGRHGTLPTGLRGRWSIERRQRLAPLSGLFAVVLFVVGIAIVEAVGDTPESGVGAQQYLEYFRGEGASIWAGTWVFLVGIVCFLWFLGSLQEALERAEAPTKRLARIAFAGGVGAALLLATSLSTLIAGAIAAEESANLSAQAAEAIWWAGNGFFVASTFFLAAFLAATALAAFRTRILPRWFAAVTAILAVAAAVPFISWAVLIFATPLWILFVAIWLAARRRAPDLAEV